MALIDIGSKKQLLFDDHVIESLTYAKQGMNRAIKADDNPVVRRDRPWEGTHMRPLCTVFDEEAGLFKMWYRSSTITVRVENGVPVLGGPDGIVVDERDRRICFATSKDGFDWDKPELGLVEFDGSTLNNILPLEEESLDAPGGPSFLDTHDPDPARRYKGMVRVGDTTSLGMQYHLYHSPDGISWTPDPANPVIDTTPELGRWQGRFMGWDPIRETYHVTMECSHHWRAPLGQAAHRPRRESRHGPLERARADTGARRPGLPRHRVLQHAAHRLRGRLYRHAVDFSYDEHDPPS